MTLERSFERPSKSLDGVSQDERVTVEDCSCGQPKILEYIGVTFFNVTHNVWDRAAQLPWPMGFTVGVLESSIGATIRPLVQTLESQSLKLLGFVDGQLVAVGDLLESSVCTALKTLRQERKLSRVPEMALHAIRSSTFYLQRRDLFGPTVDLWIRNEHILKSKSKDFLHFIEKFPGGRLIVENLIIVGGPLAERLSTWFLTNIEIKDKHLVLDNDSSPISGVDFDTHEKYEAEEKSRGSDSASKQLSDDISPPLYPPHHPSDHFFNETSSEATEYKRTNEKLVWVPEQDNAVTSEPSEYASDETKLAATHDDEHDPLIHLFEYSWSLSSPNLKKR